MTQEQDVVQARLRISELKRKMMQELRAYTNAAAGNPSAAISEALALQASANEYFNYAEDFVGNSDLLGAHKNALWVQGFAEDCHALLGSMLDYYPVLRTAFRQIPQLARQDPAPGPTAFANLQRMVVAYLPDNIVNSLRASFVAANLPVFGFDNEAKLPMNRQLNTWLAYAFGVTFLIVMLAIAILKPEPTDFQYTIFRGAFAMALAGIAAVIPGFLDLRIHKWLKAGGAIAVFVLVYFWNPALQKPDASARGNGAPTSSSSARPAAASPSTAAFPAPASSANAAPASK